MAKCIRCRLLKEDYECKPNGQLKRTCCACLLIQREKSAGADKRARKAEYNAAYYKNVIKPNWNEFYARHADAYKRSNKAFYERHKGRPYYGHYVS